jgi:hypothetical protein
MCRLEVPCFRSCSGRSGPEVGAPSSILSCSMLPSPFKDKGCVREENAGARALLSESEVLDRFGTTTLSERCQRTISDIHRMSQLALFTSTLNCGAFNYLPPHHAILPIASTTTSFRWGFLRRDQVGTRGRYAFGHCGRKDAGLQAVVAMIATATKEAGRYETAPQKMSQQRLPSLSPSLPFSSISVASMPPLSSASSARSLSGSPVPGKIVGASKDEGTARGCRLAVRPCADLRSISRTRSGRERTSKRNSVVKQDI